MQADVIALIADPAARLTAALGQLCDSINASAARIVAANSAEDFVGQCGAEKLTNVEIIVLAVFAGGQPHVVADLWPHCPNVRWIHSLTAGVDSLLPVLRPLPNITSVALTNAKGAFSRSLAEYTITAMLHFHKQVPKIQQNKADKRLEKFVVGELRGMTVGFVGFGDIAQTTARLCRAFGMKVIALRRRKDVSGDKVVADRSLSINDAEERKALFEQSDFVVCSLPGSPDTKHFCSTAEFNAMKTSAVFISVGRGTCVDEAAVVEALMSGSIAGAALDVFETEPLPRDSPVWEAPNLLVTSHTVWRSGTFVEDCWRQFLLLLRDYRSWPGEFKGTVSLDFGY